MTTKLDSNLYSNLSQQIRPSQSGSDITTPNRPMQPGSLSASLTFGWRAVLKIKHVPWQLLDATMFPILMTLLFTYIFGGAIAGSVDEYLQRLIPGILVLTVAMSSQYTAVGLNTDIAKGIFDRFRSLSFWRPAAIIGALLGDMVRYATAAFVVVMLGLGLGFQPEAGPSGVLLAIGFVLLFAFSLSWIWTTIGLLVDNPETVSMISSLASFPLLFISNVFVDPVTMPHFMQQIVKVNPVSLTAAVTRGFMHGSVKPVEIVTAVAACAVLVAVFAPLTMYLYNNKNIR